MTLTQTNNATHNSAHNSTHRDNTSTPTVSVVVPNYNYARYLDRRMDSILKQSFQDFEIIILDDCSTDNSTEVIEKYRNNPKVSLIRVNKTNSGSTFMQWKTGIEAARGKYVWIAEADDEALPEFLEKTVAALEGNPGAAIAFTGSYIINENGVKQDYEFDKWSKLRCANKLPLRVLDGEKYISHNLYWANYVYNASMVLFRRDRYTHNIIADCVKMRNTGDWLFWINLAASGQVVEIYEKLNLYRKHGCSVTDAGAVNGNGLREELFIIKYIETHFKVSRYRKILRHGHFIKCLRRNKSVSPEMRRDMYETLRESLGATQKSFVIERANRVLGHACPLLISKQRDRL